MLYRLVKKLSPIRTAYAESNSGVETKRGPHIVVCVDNSPRSVDILQWSADYVFDKAGKVIGGRKISKFGLVISFPVFIKLT